MPDTIRHVAINADDLPTTLDFYRTVFGWEFTEYFPGFYRMAATQQLDVVAIQQRRELLPDARTLGFECTVGVDDLRATIGSALAQGGRVLAEPAVIPRVGELVWLADPSGNVLGAMQYEKP